MYGKIKYIITFLTAACGALCFCCSLNAAVVLKKLEINPLNRVALTFSEFSWKYTAKLSEDKRKITLKIPGADFASNVSDVHSQGIIQEVFLQNFEDTLVISVILKDSRGFTLTPLPFSNRIYIETFQWDKISPAEDNYRLGLISIHDNIYLAAGKYFQKSAAAGYPEALLQLGILKLREGNIGDAEKILLSLERSGSRLPDLFAGLSQVYKFKGNEQLAQKYLKLFKNLAGIQGLKFLDADVSPETETDTDEPPSLLNEFALSGADSTKDSSAADSLRTDSLAADSALGATDSAGESDKDDSFFESWLPSIFIYVIFFGGLLLIVLISSYMKWKKQRILQMKKSAKPGKESVKKNTSKAGANIKPEANDGAAKGTPSNYAANAYKKASQPVGNEAPPSKELPPPEPLDEIVREKSLDEKLDRIARELSAKRPDAFNESQQESADDIIAPHSNAQPVSAKLQLAMRLREEQNKLKNRQPNEQADDFNPDLKKLNEIAQKFGIDKEKTSPKKTPPQMSSDKNALKKLSEKFGKPDDISSE